jgi:hypothetical protein
MFPLFDFPSGASTDKLVQINQIFEYTNSGTREISIPLPIREGSGNNTKLVGVIYLTFRLTNTPNDILESINISDQVAAGHGSKMLKLKKFYDDALTKTTTSFVTEFKEYYFSLFGTRLPINDPNITIKSITFPK